MKYDLDEQTREVLCPRCIVPMRPGKALVNNLGGVADFAGDKYPVTVSPDGTARIMDCLKCPECGHSENKGINSDKSVLGLIPTK